MGNEDITKTQVKGTRGKAPVKIVPLKYVDVFRAAKTHGAAFENDPLMRYGKNRVGKPSFLISAIEQAQIAAYLIICIRTDVITLTVDSGIANITVKSPPECSEEPRADPVIRLAKGAMKLLGLWLRHLDRDPEETAKRRKEIEERLTDEDIQRRIVGDRIDKLWYVDGIFTDPSSQGHGYGSALLEAATTIADNSGRAVWLVSSNILNTKFYNEHGFETIETVFIGDQNPTWHEKPIPVCIMVREPSCTAKSISEGTGKVPGRHTKSGFSTRLRSLLL